MADTIGISQLSAEEFYQTSQDRTRRYLGGSFFESARIGVAVSPEIISSFSGQVLVLSTMNLLSRFVRFASLAIPNTPLHPFLACPGALTLLERVKVEMSGANPFAEYDFGGSITGTTDYALQLGGADPTGQRFDLFADGDGWNAFVGRGNESPIQEHSSLNPVGPAAAACLAVADVFKALTNVPGPLKANHRVLSLFDFSCGDSPRIWPSGPYDLDIGTTQMIGVGSVGSAVVYLLSLLPVHGHLVLIDHQSVEFENLDRSAIFMAADVQEPKVEVAKEWLRRGNLQVTANRMDYSEFIEQNGRGKPSPDLILLLANERNVYSVLQNNFPPLVVYGTTTTGWGVNLGRHIPMREECVLCRYPNQATPAYKCASTQLSTPEQVRVDASLPFLSFMAGVTAMAELLKTQMDGYPFHGNYAYMDLMGPLQSIAVIHRDRQDNCSCSQQSSGIYRNCVAGSRFARLSVQQR